jgi:hypothetical protein
MNLSELFNPPFFVYLGILLLIVSFMVYYYESKMREQNHKISSMLSLVSSMAEELNIVRNNMNLMVMNGVNNGVTNGGNNQIPSQVNNFTPNFNNSLIHVSDDESCESNSNDDSDNNSLSDDDVSSESDALSESDDKTNDDNISSDSDSDSDEPLQNLKIGDKIDTNGVKVLNIHLGDNLDELCDETNVSNTDDI